MLRVDFVNGRLLPLVSDRLEPSCFSSIFQYRSSTVLALLKLFQVIAVALLPCYPAYLYSSYLASLIALLISLSH